MWLAKDDIQFRRMQGMGKSILVAEWDHQCNKKKEEKEEKEEKEK